MAQRPVGGLDADDDGGIVTRGSSRPLYVAGVAGGVGTSTWTRAFRTQVRLPVEDRGVYLNIPVDVQDAHLVDVLVTSNTAAATAQLGRALARCVLPPLLVVMHTVPGSIPAARAHLRKAEPHVTRQFDVAHQRVWLGLDEPPGRYLPKGFPELIRAIPSALREMYSTPVRPPKGNPAMHLERNGSPVANAGLRDLKHMSWPSGSHAHNTRRG